MDSYSIKKQTICMYIFKTDNYRGFYCYHHCRKSFEHKKKNNKHH